MQLPDTSLVDCLRRKAAERRLLAARSGNGAAQALLAQAAEFEALAEVLQRQDAKEGIPALLPARRTFP